MKLNDHQKKNLYLFDFSYGENNPFNVLNKKDRIYINQLETNSMLNYGLICIEVDNLISWIGGDGFRRYDDIKRLCINKVLYYNDGNIYIYIDKDDNYQEMILI
jgi:hypothetical protein